MDKYTSVPDRPPARERDDATAAADSIHSDFKALVSMLDREFSKLSDADVRAKAHMSEARNAAMRGLDLSARLIGLMKGADAKN